MAEQRVDPGLYLVGTPIGNLDDITLRALRVLQTVDCIACEDTRQTQKLLNHFSIATPTLSFHQHNEQARTAELLVLLEQGGRIAVVSDAGMPAFSDPGLPLVRAAVAAGVPVYPIPGANAATAALIASGLETNRFLYLGFLPAKAGERRSELEALAARIPALTLVIYEAPHRVLETLADVEAVWGGSVRVVVARELTKLHEEFLRGSAAEVRQRLAERERVRGEIVLLVEAVPQVESTRTVGTTRQQVEHLIASEGIDEKDALKRLARDRGVSKSEIYRELQRSKK